MLKVGAVRLVLADQVVCPSHFDYAGSVGLDVGVGGGLDIDLVKLFKA